MTQASTHASSHDSRAMARMRAALAEIARTDDLLADDAAAIDIVEIPAGRGAVLKVTDKVRFNANFAEHVSHGEAVKILRARLEDARIKGASPQARTAH